MSYTNKSISNNLPKGLFSLWVAFSLSLLVYLTPIVLSNFIGVFYFPIIALLLSVVVYSILSVRRKAKGGEVECMLPLYVMARVMLTYGVIMLFINLCVLRLSDLKVDLMEIDKSFHFYYYPVLLLSVISIFYSFFSSKNVCKFCIHCNGTSIENSVYNNLQRSVIVNTMRSLLIISIVVAIAGWIYFFILYNSANVSAFDRLIFSGVPVIIALMHEVTLSLRFLSLSYHQDQLYTMTPFLPNKSIQRFIVVDKDNLLLQLKEDGKYDTPIVVTTPYSENVDVPRYEEKIQEKYNIEFNSIKLLFSNEDHSFNSSINHFLCFVNGDTLVALPDDSSWISTSELERIDANKKLTPLMRSEVYRLFSTLLAYKEFDSNGNPRYKIKGYRPTVNIADLSKYDLDYNDKRWRMLFSIGRNKNSVMSKLRLFFYKYIEGTID